MSQWISAKNHPPKDDGWYFVYAPGYMGQNRIWGMPGLAYSKFEKNYKRPWGIERGRGWDGIITHWMPMPDQPKTE